MYLHRLAVPPRGHPRGRVPGPGIVEAVSAFAGPDGLRDAPTATVTAVSDVPAAAAQQHVVGAVAPEDVVSRPSDEQVVSSVKADVMAAVTIAGRAAPRAEPMDDIRTVSLLGIGQWRRSADCEGRRSLTQ